MRSWNLKRKTTAGIATLFLMSGIVPVAVAEEQIEEEASQEEAQAQEEEELIETLTLEDAIQYAMDENTSLLLLDYRLQHLQSQVNELNHDQRDLARDIEDLEDSMSDLRDKQRETGQNTFQTRYQIQQQIDQLEDTLEELEDAYKELTSNQVSFEYQQEEAEESTKLATTSTFMGIVMKEEQLSFLKKALETEQQRVKNAQKRYEIGVDSRNDFHTAQRELTRMKFEIEQLEREIENDVSVFALDIGIVYHPDLQLEPPSVEELTIIEQEIDTEELIENSYQMKQAKEALALAEYNQEQAYEDSDASSYEREQADLQVQIEKENINQLKMDLTNAIDELFLEAAQQYDAVMNARYELDYAEEDTYFLSRQWEVGLLPKAEYELAQLQVEQAQFEYDMAKYQYFLLAQQIESLKNGIIPTSTGNGGGNGFSL